MGSAFLRPRSRRAASTVLCRNRLKSSRLVLAGGAIIWLVACSQPVDEQDTQAPSSPFVLEGTIHLAEFQVDGRDLVGGGSEERLRRIETPEDLYAMKRAIEDVGGAPRFPERCPDDAGLSRGATLVVRDAEDVIVGTARLSGGEPIATAVNQSLDEPDRWGNERVLLTVTFACAFEFQSGPMSASEFYSIFLEGRLIDTYSREELDRLGWKLTLFAE